MSAESERRAHDRLSKAYRLELSAFVFPLDAQPRYEAVCDDVSAGGLAVTVPHQFTAGDKVLVRLHMFRLNKFHPGFFKTFENDVEQSLQAVAEVVRVSGNTASGGYKTGLCFTDVYEDDWTALRGLIQAELRRLKQRSQT